MRRSSYAIIPGTLFVFLVIGALKPLSSLQQPPVRTLRGDANLRTVDLDPRAARQLTSSGVFFNRVTGATQLPSGVIAVANRGNNELLFFDSLGRTLGSAGLKGAGPEDFTQMANVVRLGGDTIAVLDLQLRRISLFTPRRFLRDYPVRAPNRANSPPSLGELYSGFDNGELLIWLQTVPRNEADVRRWNQPYTVAQVPVVLFTIDASGAVAKVVGEFPGDDKYIGNMNGTPVNMGPAPFGGWTRFATARGRIFVFRNTEPAINVYNSSGELVTVFRFAWPPRKVSVADRRAYLALA